MIAPVVVPGVAGKIWSETDRAFRAFRVYRIDRLEVALEEYPLERGIDVATYLAAADRLGSDT